MGLMFGACSLFGDGWGTRASSPLGVRGVMTMKMISRTRRMSISGTTFISAIAPLLVPTCIPMTSFLSGGSPPGWPFQRRSSAPFRPPGGLILAGFDLGRNQPNLIYIRGVHDVNGARHLLKRHFLVALDEGYALGAGLEDLGE